MSKLPVALFAAFVAVATIFSSAAEAGFKIRLGFGGPLHAFNAHGNGGYKKHHHRRRYIARRVKKEKVYVAKRKVSEPKVAKVEKKVSKPVVVATVPVIEPEVIADSENSSITTAALDTASVEPAAVTPVEVKAEAVEAKPAVSKPEKAAKLDCKKFFPSAGMTLSVPCE